MTAPSALLGDIRPTRADRSIPIKNPARRLFPAFRLPDTAPSFLAALAGAFVGRCSAAG